jgi:hypothetical protein
MPMALIFMQAQAYVVVTSFRQELGNKGRIKILFVQ